MLIECKTISSRLGDNEIAQLFRYFATTDAPFAILTNGVVWKFFTDLAARNRMDERPFFTVNLEELDDFHLLGLRHFAKDHFDANNIRSMAERDRIMDAIYKAVDEEFHEPSDDFIRYFVRKVHEGRLGARLVDQYRPFVIEALQLHFDLMIEGALQTEGLLPEGSEASNGHGTGGDAPDFNLYADYVNSRDSTKELFDVLRVELEGIGTDMGLEVRKSRFSFQRTHGRRESVFAAIHVRKQYLQVYLKVDPRTVDLAEGFSHDVRDKFTPCASPLLVMVRNQADIRRARPLIRRSYDEVG
ncbi:MAG: type I restriction enzyme HsdR N-terminal domain-containing protein [Anaerolineae bacterium]|nr:type I restriction enzyme HsdR N-terminal domain-containing protein [Anaerolineae bacterium]